MQTCFHIARHFWQNKENACWQISKNFPAKLLEVIKAEYSTLETEMPEHRQYGHGTVFFSYKEAKDIYGRRTIEITAATCGKVVLNPHALSKIILRNLEQPFQESSEFYIDLEPNNLKDNSPTVHATHSSLKLFKLVLSSVIILFLTGWFLFQHNEKKTIHHLETGSSKLPVQDDQRENSNMIEHSTEEGTSKLNFLQDIISKEFCAKYRSIKIVPPYIDGKCIEKYIESQCKVCTRLSYESWINNEVKNNLDKKCKGIKPSADVIYVAQQLKNEYKIPSKLTRQFLNGETSRR